MLLLAGFIAGAFQVLAFAPWLAQQHAGLPAAVQAVAIALLLAALHRAPRPALGAWVAWAFGTSWLAGSTAWLHVSLHTYGGLPAWLSLLSIALLCAALSLYMALAGWLWVRWRRQLWANDALLFGALWALAEMARALIFTGFPWAASGYALIDSPWAGLAPWLGVYGMGQVMVTCVALLVLAVCSRMQVWLAAGLVTMVVMCCMALGGLSFVSPHGRALQVTLLQSNVPQEEKFAISRQVDALVWHGEQLVAAKGDLVMAPETAIPLLPADLPDGYWQSLLRHFHRSKTAALIGVPLGSMQAGYTNSVVGISPSTVDAPDGFYRYNKHHLVPFGEFIPTGFHWFVRMMSMPLGDFTRGPRNAPSFEVAGQWIAPNICYEDLFGEELAARFTSGQTPAPTVLANVSNLAWFGQHVAIEQHAQIARMRSLEFQRPTIRSTNTGATVVIDHQGRITAQQPLNTRGALQASVQGMQGLTPFARWAGPWGLWPLLAMALGMVWVLRQRSP